MDPAGLHRENRHRSERLHQADPDLPAHAVTIAANAHAPAVSSE